MNNILKRFLFLLLFPIKIILVVPALIAMMIIGCIIWIIKGDFPDNLMERSMSFLADFPLKE